MGMQEALLKAMQGLQGQKDSKGIVGTLARGKNMYPGGNAAQSGGGPQMGAPSSQPQNPMMEAQLRALKQQQAGMQANAGATAPNPMQQMGGAPPNPNPLPNPAMNQTQGLGDVGAGGAMKLQQAQTMASAALKAAAQRRLRGNLR